MAKGGGRGAHGGGGGHHGGGGGHHGAGDRGGGHLAATQAAMHHPHHNQGGRHGGHHGHGPGNYDPGNYGPGTYQPPDPQAQGKDGMQDVPIICLFVCGVLLLFTVPAGVREYRENVAYESPLNSSCKVVDSMMDDWFDDKGDHHFEGIVTVSFPIEGDSDVVTATKATQHPSLCKGSAFLSIWFTDNTDQGTSFGCATAFLKKFPLGSRVPCWYDPLSPYDRAILARPGYANHGLWALLALLLAAPPFCCFICFGVAHDRTIVARDVGTQTGTGADGHGAFITINGVQGGYGSVGTTEPSATVVNVMPQPWHQPSAPPAINLPPRVAPAAHPLPHLVQRPPTAAPEISAANPF